EAITQLGEVTMKISRAAEQRLGRRFLTVAGGPPPLPMRPGEAWSDRAIADLEAMPEAQRKVWIDLLDHCQSATGSKPSAKWARRAAELREGVDDFAATITRWLPLVDKPSTEHRQPTYAGAPDPNLLIIDPHADLLKGLC